jgi:adenylate cyclase
MPIAMDEMCYVAAPEPVDDLERVKALHDLNILDTVAEKRFDDLVRLTQKLFKTPICYISLIDEQRQWFKSRVGLDISETPRNISLCGHTILQSGPLIIPDTHADPRFAQNPLVAQDPHIRFYAGQSLCDKAGYRIGTLCLADRQPRQFTEPETELLQDVAKLAERELTLGDVIRLQQKTLNLQSSIVNKNAELVRLHEQVIRERDTSDRLLLNILPAKIAQELKEDGQVKAIDVADACVMFTDFSDFTAISAKFTPEELVEELNVCFSRFDEITAKYGVEKVKTLGDGYLCVSGVLEPGNDAGLMLARAAVEIRDFITERGLEFFAQKKRYWNVRIGLHRGPLVAGVVGTKKFTFDVWGNTVNTASRLESSSLPGQINVSAAFQSKLPEGAICEPRGLIEARGNGPLDMFFLHRLPK